VPADAEAREVVVIASVVAALAIATVAEFVWAGELLSLTTTVKLKVPLAVGVPDITPAEERENPGGNWPELIVQM
jgi:hypothetical protein